MHTLSLSLALYIYIWLLWQKRSHGCCKWSITCVTDFLMLPVFFSNSEEEVWVWWALKVVGRHRRIAAALRRSCAAWKHLHSLFAGGIVGAWQHYCQQDRAFQSLKRGLWPLLPTGGFSWLNLGLNTHQHRHFHRAESHCGRGCQELPGNAAVCSPK